MSEAGYQRGVTLIEVLVALFVLSIGLLAVAMMQLRGLENASAGYLRSQAVILANDIGDRIRYAGSNAGDYAFAMPGTPFDCSDLSLEGAFSTANDLAEWQNLVGCRLPEGNASVEESAGIYTIRIVWSSREDDDDEASLERVEVGVVPHS
jgi:type IV pilus assembly protein PilV